MKDFKFLCGCNELFLFVFVENEMFLRFSFYRKNNWFGFYVMYKVFGEVLFLFL